MTEGPRSPNLPSLTSLRFFAALMVGLFHASAWSSGTASEAGKLGPFRFGYVGVTFFYILSGFVLTWTLRPQERRRFFYVRRFARVYPLHLLMTLVALALAAFGVEIVQSPKAIVLNLTLLQAWIHDNDIIYSLNSPAWSLSNEAFFYAVFPLLAAIVAPRKRASVVLTIIGTGWLLGWGLLAVLRAPEYVDFLYTFPLYRIGEFLIGIGLALAIKQGLRVPVPVWAAVTVAGVGYLVVWLGNWLTNGVFERNSWAANFVVLPSFLLVIMAAASRDAHGSTAVVLHNRWLIRLGQWSFALYLIHELLLRLSRRLFPDLPPGLDAVLPYVVVAVAIPLSGVLYEWFERPIERRIRSWSKQQESIMAQTVPKKTTIPR